MTILTCSTTQNINTIAAGAVAGDTIELAAGTHYLAAIYIKPATHAHGTSGSPITITSAAGGTATISVSSSNYQILIEDMDYWIVDGVDVANFTNNGVLVAAGTRDSTGCQLLNMDISNQSISTTLGNKWPAGYHTVSVGGDPQTGKVGVLKDFYAYNVNIYNGRPWVSETPYDYNEIFTIIGDCDGVEIDTCSINQSRSGIAFHILGVGGGTYAWRSGQPKNVTYKSCRVIDLQNHSGTCTAFYADRPGDNCTWDGNFAYNVKTLFSWGFEANWDLGCLPANNGVFKNNRAVIKANGVYGGNTGWGLEIGTYNNSGVTGDIDIFNNVILFKDSTSWPAAFVHRRCLDHYTYNNLFAYVGGSTGLTWVGWAGDNTFDSTWAQRFENNQYWTTGGGGQWALPTDAATTSIDGWNVVSGVSGEFIKEPTFTNIDGNTYDDFFVTNSGAPAGVIEANFTYTKSALTVNFTDTSVSSSTLDEWDWDFDYATPGVDVSTSADPTNVYAADGTYQVRLTASSDEGSDSIIKVISVATAGSGDGSISEQITAGGDDAEGNAGSWWYDNLGWCSFGDKESASSSYDFSAGLRFTLSEAIPSNAIITSATVDLYAVWRDGSGLPTARIYAEDAADPADWTNQADYDGRTLTTAYQDWAISSWTLAQWHESPNFLSVIQELVDDNGGLASGAHISIRIEDSVSGWGGTNTLISFQSYDGGATNAPKLYITWDTPSTASRMLKRKLNQGFLSPMNWEID